MQSNPAERRRLLTCDTGSPYQRLSLGTEGRSGRIHPDGAILPASARS